MTEYPVDSAIIHVIKPDKRNGYYKGNATVRDMKALIPIRSIFLVSLALFPLLAEAVDEGSVHRALSDALLCRGKPEHVVYDLVRSGSDFVAGYASAEFGEGTSEKAVVILRRPLRIGAATASLVVSEVENSNFDFAAFTYALFEGDYRKTVLDLKLQPVRPFNDESLGRFVSQQPREAECPPTITLTPQDDSHFLLGCGWCNGG